MATVVTSLPAGGSSSQQRRAGRSSIAKACLSRWRSWCSRSIPSSTPGWDRPPRLAWADVHLCHSRHGSQRGGGLCGSARPRLCRLFRHRRLYDGIPDIAHQRLCPARVRAGWLQHFWPAIAISWIMAASFGILAGRADAAAARRLPRHRDAWDLAKSYRTFSSMQKRSPEAHAGSIRSRMPTALPSLGITFSFTPSDQRNWYWLILAIACLSFFMIRRFYNSRLGRTWAAIREDEIAASSMGVNLVKTKLWRSPSARRSRIRGIGLRLLFPVCSSR